MELFIERSHEYFFMVTLLAFLLLDILLRTSQKFASSRSPFLLSFRYISYWCQYFFSYVTSCIYLVIRVLWGYDFNSILFYLCQGVYFFRIFLSHYNVVSILSFIRNIQRTFSFKSLAKNWNKLISKWTCVELSLEIMRQIQFKL